MAGAICLAAARPEHAARYDALPAVMPAHMVRASGQEMTNAAPYGTHMRAIRLWLYAVAALVAVMVLVGGVTRLTESGLSITEWRPVMGVLPPLSDSGWQEVFAKYRAIPQYQALNAGMSLGDFKTIYRWEWTHRLLGRVIGAAFLLPFLWFLWRGWIPRRAPPAAVVHLCAWRVARRGRLVDGGVGPIRTDRGFAISVGDASHPRQRHLCSAHLDGRDALRSSRDPRPRRHQSGRAHSSRSCSCANLSRRAGRGIARGLRLQ